MFIYPFNLFLQYRFHRAINCGTLYHNNLPLGTWAGSSQDQDVTYTSGASSTSGFNPRALHSWVYPQSPLPASVISALSLADRGGIIWYLFVSAYLLFVSFLLHPYEWISFWVLKVKWASWAIGVRLGKIHFGAYTTCLERRSVTSSMVITLYICLCFVSGL